MAVFKQYTLKDGTKKWLFKAYLGIDESTNKQITTTRRGFRSRKEAVIAEKQLQHEVIENGFNKIEITTFDEIYKMWFDSYKKTVKETTSLKTASHFKKHISPVFGSLRIDKINMKVCQKAVNDWSEKFEMYGLLMQYSSKVMDYALRLELIQKNPFHSVIKPAKKKKIEHKLKYYTTDEIKQVMIFLENKVQKATSGTLLQKYFAELDRAIFRLMAFTGIRVGEGLALSFKDFNFDTNTLTISKTLSDTRNGRIISTPKTKSSNRIISVDEKTMHIMKTWQLRQKEYLLAKGITNANLVFVQFDGSMMQRQDIYQRSKRLSTAVGLHVIGSHGYRHSHASMLFEAGANMKEAQERLGHSSISMTMDVYTHVNQKAKKETVRKLEKFANF